MLLAVRFKGRNQAAILVTLVMEGSRHGENDQPGSSLNPYIDQSRA
jgi:hypothetical protein